MKLNKGDVILICILIATFVFFAVNELNIFLGLEQYDSSFTTLFGVIFGGELLSFAIYKIGMAKYDSQQKVGLAKYDVNSQVVSEIEEDIQTIKDAQEKKGAHANE